MGYPDQRLSHDFYRKGPRVEMSDEASVRSGIVSARRQTIVKGAPRWRAIARGGDPGRQVLAPATLRDRIRVGVGQRPR
jgi:hypothetical protein